MIDAYNIVPIELPVLELHEIYKGPSALCGGGMSGMTFVLSVRSLNGCVRNVCCWNLFVWDQGSSDKNLDAD